MIGLMNDKAAMPFPVPETNSAADNLFYRKDNTGPSNFENYLKAATQGKPVRNKDSDVNYQTAGRYHERTENKTEDFAKQVAGESSGPKSGDISTKIDDDGTASKGQVNTDNVPDKSREQSTTEDPVFRLDGAQTGATVAAQVLIPVGQIPDHEPAEPVTESEVSTKAIAGLSQLKAGELTGDPNSETDGDAVNNNSRITAGQPVTTNQRQVEAPLNLTPDSEPAGSPVVPKQITNGTPDAVINAGTQNRETVTPELTAQPHVKIIQTSASGQKGDTLNTALLQVFQQKVVAQTTIQNVTHHNEKPQPSMQSVVTAQTVTPGTGDKPLNLALLQTQNSITESLDKINGLPVTPLQQYQAGEQSQAVTMNSAVWPVEKEQLFTQIVEHAKLMLAGSQSELEISLKPDHLGKLQLKILVENQAVTARFMAESQQVKQIIETNLNQLRDQLRETGLQVDNLAVSVGTGAGDQTAGNRSYLGGNHDFSVHGLDFAADDSEIPAATGTAATPKSLRETVIDLIA